MVTDFGTYFDLTDDSEDDDDDDNNDGLCLMLLTTWTHCTSLSILGLSDSAVVSSSDWYHRANDT